MGDIKIFSGTSNQNLYKSICKNLDINESKTYIDYFSNGETLPKIHETVRDQRIFIVQTGVSSIHTINDIIIETYLLARTCHRSHAKDITLIMPCYPYARQDKKDRSKGAISGKDVADLFTNAFIDRVICFDLHCEQIQGFFNIPIDNLRAEPLFINYLKNNYFKDDQLYKEHFVLVSPDFGALKMGKKFSEKIDIPCLVINKERDYEKKNEVEKITLIGNPKYIKNRTVIILDDMCDTFGTAQKACDTLTSLGAKDIIFIATHGILSGPAIERINNTPSLKLFLTTNSIDQTENIKKTDKIVQLDIGETISKVINCLQDNTPISDIFLY